MPLNKFQFKILIDAAAVRTRLTAWEQNQLAAMECIKQVKGEDWTPDPAENSIINKLGNAVCRLDKGNFNYGVNPNNQFPTPPDSRYKDNDPVELTGDLYADLGYRGSNRRRR